MFFFLVFLIIEGFGIELDTLKKIILEKEVTPVTEMGGVTGLGKALQTDLEHGLNTSAVSNDPSAVFSVAGGDASGS